MSSIKEYAEELLKAAGASVDDVKKQAFLELLGNDKIANGFVPRSEYSRSLDAKDAEVKKVKDEAAAYYAQETERAARNQKVVDEAQTRLQKYVTTYGELSADGGGPIASPAFDASKYVSRDDYQKAIDQVSQQALFVTKEGLKAASHHLHTFGEPLDVDALEKFALEHKLPINQAYSEMIRPKLEAKTNSSFEEKLKQAREEGAREALSRVKVPIDTQPKEPSVFANYRAQQATAAAAGGAAKPAMSTMERLASFEAAYDGADAAASK